MNANGTQEAIIDVTHGLVLLDLGTLGANSSRMEVRLELGDGVVIHVTRG
jgi:hypothetical protein